MRLSSRIVFIAALIIVTLTVGGWRVIPINRTYAISTKAVVYESCTLNCGSYGSPGATFQYSMSLSPGTTYNYFFVFSALVYPSNQPSSWADPVGPAAYSITCSASCASVALMNQVCSNQDNDPD